MITEEQTTHEQPEQDAPAESALPAPHIEALLSARLFLVPQLWNDRIYFISNMSGHFSLYSMRYGGSVPEPLLPPDIALQNPELIGGWSFYIYPELGKIMVAIDSHGDEKYSPMLIPIEGGFPESAFPSLTNAQIFSRPAAKNSNDLLMVAASLTEPINRTYIGDLETGQTTLLRESEWGSFPLTINDDGTKAILAEGYTVGDSILQLWQRGEPGLKRLFGTPLSEREPGKKVEPNGIGSAEFAPGGQGVLVINSLTEDTYGLDYLDLDKPGELQPVQISGLKHEGVGELTDIQHLHDDLYLLQYNIDGVSWAYEGIYDSGAKRITLQHVIIGEGELAGGVVEGVFYDDKSDRFVLAFCTAALPTQIYSVEGSNREKIVRHTEEHILGVPASHMSPGEDASFHSHDGLRISARLYLPSPELGYRGPRPLVYYIHGGPQGQERPNFAWFSMPLIQFLTLNGFAVFVPNVRGSTGYGLSYTKFVDRDWGGQDRLDHVYAMTEVLTKEPRVDVKRAGVIGRSYGGYMTLTLAMRHPELWSAAVDMFGPYDLVLSFLERIPATWKPYFYEALGHPVKDRDFLMERSPKTHMNNLTAPMLVIQGANDPRVIERESRDVVEGLREVGKEVEYIVFENEGHDVIKFENKVRCYNAITDFFSKHLRP